MAHRILPGKDIPPKLNKKGERLNYDEIGIMQATCPFCFTVARQDAQEKACEHFYRVTGGCGVAAAFEFFNPSEGRY